LAGIVVCHFPVGADVGVGAGADAAGSPLLQLTDNPIMRANEIFIKRLLCRI
jgi:hypothetical protein